LALRVAVGTGNPMKVRAVALAFKRFIDVDEVVGVEVESGVASQPVGWRDVVLGALNRAVNAMKAANADMGVGVEAGPVEMPGPRGFLETQVAVIVDEECRASMGVSPSFELEPGVLDLVLKGVELSRAVSIRRGERDLGENVGVIGVYTWGAVTRQDLTWLSVVMALVPRIAGYSKLASVNDIAEAIGAEHPHCPP